jgi:hypothetical protein
MTYNFANDRFTNYREEAQTERTQPVARFKLNDQHDLIVRKVNDGYKFTLTVTCDTCSISETASKAVIFAYKNGIFRMMIDGANFKRI